MYIELHILATVFNAYHENSIYEIFNFTRPLCMKSWWRTQMDRPDWAVSSCCCNDETSVLRPSTSDFRVPDSCSLLEKSFSTCSTVFLHLVSSCYQQKSHGLYPDTTVHDSMLSPEQTKLRRRTLFLLQRILHSLKLLKVMWRCLDKRVSISDMETVVNIEAGWANRMVVDTRWLIQTKGGAESQWQKKKN